MEYQYEICKKLDLDPEKLLKRKIRGLPGFNTQELIFALIYSDNLMQTAEILGYPSNGPIKTAIKSLLSPLFDNRTKRSSLSWRTELLNLISKKYCNSCKKIKDLDDFRNHIGRTYNKSCYCSSCMTANNKKYKLAILQRTPKWADLNIIKDIYNNCPTDCEVDHIIPLRGKLVSGLHVENNLQYLSVKENHIKNNTYIAD